MTLTANDPVFATATATELDKEFTDNTVDSVFKYEDQILEVTGTVSRMLTDVRYQPGGLTVELKRANASAPIRCGFNPDQHAAAKALASGFTVTVRGRCTGRYLSMVHLKDCFITPPGPRVVPGPPKMQAAALTKAFKDNLTMSAIKYKGKVLEVTGTVGKVDRTTPEQVSIVFRTSDGALLCELVEMEADRASEN